MIKKIAKTLNAILSPFGVKIARASNDSFDMPSAIKRIADHDIDIRSIIDIGASNGNWSLEAMNAFPDASFVALEPLKERQESLRALKKKHPNFDYILCVAGEKDGGQTTLNVSDDLDGSTVGGYGGEPRIVPVKTLDAIVKEKRLEGPYLIKFDTHGFEIPILNGAKETLAKTNIIVMEVYNFKITEHALRFHEICFQMEKLGFRCCDLANPMLRLHDKVFWQIDLFFARTDSKIFSYGEYK